MYDFYIESSELCVPYRPRRCIIRHMASTDNRLDLAVVDVYPPLGREVYSTESEIKALIVVPKFAGEDLSSKFNGKMWVWVCRADNPDKTRFLPADLRIIDYAYALQVRNDGIPHYCPVCNYSGLSENIVCLDGMPSFEICPSCGFQFGVDDEKGITYDAWRDAWIKGGMKWWNDRICQPPNWDPIKQLVSRKLISQ